jgi:hypothetical protein
MTTAASRVYVYLPAENYFRLTNISAINYGIGYKQVLSYTGPVHNTAGPMSVRFGPSLVTFKQLFWCDLNIGLALLSEMSGSHNGDYEYDSLLGRGAA